MKTFWTVLWWIVVIACVIWILRMLNDGTLSTPKIQAIITIIVEVVRLLIVALANIVILLVWLGWQLLFYAFPQMWPPPPTPPFVSWF